MKVEKENQKGNCRTSGLHEREAAVYRKPGNRTIEDYYALPEDVRGELIDGELYKMEAPSFVHQRIVAELWKQIDAFLTKKGGPCIAVFAPVAVRLDRDDKTMLEPDVLVVCDPKQITKRCVEGAPDFVAEIVSPSTASRDYIKKVAKYEKAGVKEYWIIDPEKHRLLIYHFAGDASPQIRGIQGKAGVHLYQGELQIDLDVFARIMEQGY